MGKTKTAIVPGEATEAKTSEAAYKEKRLKKVHIAGLKGGQRIKIVESEVVKTSGEEPSEALAKEAGKVPREPKVRGKKYLQSKSKIDRNKLYSIADAIKLVKESSYSKFDGTMELHLVVKKTGTSAQVTLPHSAGKAKRVEVANEATIKKLEKGKIDFDVLLATADMMPKLIPFAKILGPKGLMPNPKNGTLISDIKKAKSFAGNSVTVKTEKEAPLIHTVVGKTNQEDKEITANIQAIFQALQGTKQVSKAYLKATMSPSVKLQLN